MTETGKRRSVVLVGLGVLAALSGCAPANHLVFTTYTKVGLDLSAVGQTPTHVLLGYKRFEGALIPVDLESKAGQAGEAQSVYAGFNLENDWFQGLKITQAFATGKAAQKAASNPNVGLGMILNTQAPATPTPSVTPKEVQ